MTSSYTLNQGLEKPAAGDQSGTWGGTVNTNMDIIDRVVSGVGALTLTGSTTTLTTTDGTLTEGMYRVLVLGDGGDLGSNNTITISPNDQDKLYLVYNNLTANRSAIFTQGSGDNATVENGETAWIYADGAGGGAAVRVGMSSTKLLDQDGDTGIRVEEGGDDDDTIRFDIAGAEDFTMTANTFTALSGSDVAIASGATITNSGTATGFGADAERAIAGVLEANANFVDQVIFGPSVDGQSWNGAWSKASVFSSLMLATVEDPGSAAQVNIWDLTEQSSGTISTTPLATVNISGAATPTSIAASMGYLIVGSEDGIAIIDPHSGAWAERTKGWPKTSSTSTTPALAANDVQGVAACVAQQPAFDPRTGGPMPTFGVKYVSGTAKANSIIKDDGNIWDIAGDGSSQADYGIAFIGSRLITAYDGDQLRLAQDPSLITADQSVNPPYSWKANGAGGWNIAHAPDVAASNGYLTALGAGEGLGITKGVIQDLNSSQINTISADITRAYNTGYYTYQVIGLWLANSKTADRGPQTNTLTENGTVPTGAVASGAELTAYGVFSASNNLTRASDADWDVVGTGSIYSSIWFNSTGPSTTEYLLDISNSGQSIRFEMRLNGDDTLNFIVQGASAYSTFDTGFDVADSVWHKADFVHVSSTERYMYIDGVQVGSATTNTGSISSSGNLPLGIGVFAGNGSSGPATTTKLALARVSVTPPTATQVREMYDAEKGMFVANAECLLQSGSTDAVLDVDVDPLSGKVIVTQTDAITVFDGLAVDSKPTVNSGASEKGKLWGDLRAEQNSANAYVTAPAVDQRQVNEMVRGLASDLPKGVDLSKAKAWAYITGAGSPVFSASYNIKSLTDNGTGAYRVDFGIPFKSINYVSVGNSIIGSNFNVVSFIHAIQSRDRHHADYYVTIASTGAYIDDVGTCVLFFGELENE